jgi:Aspartyl protease
MIRITITLLFACLAGCAAKESPALTTNSADLTKTEISVKGRTDLPGYWRVPLQLTGNGLVLVEAECRGQKLTFILDTGASGTVFDQNTAFRLGAKQSINTLKSVGIAKNTVTVRELEPLDLKIGDGVVRVRGTRQDFTHIRINHMSRGVQQIDGLLGFDVLRAHRAVIDFREPALYLRPVGD